MEVSGGGVNARVAPAGMSSKDGGQELASPGVLSMHAAERCDSADADVDAGVQVASMTACLKNDGVSGGVRSGSEGPGNGVLEGA